MRKLLSHSVVPLLKVDVCISGLSSRGCLPADLAEKILSTGEDTFLSLDISIDAPSHSGLATTEFVKSMIATYPVLGPAVFVLKTFFKAKVAPPFFILFIHLMFCQGLSDPYSGGLSSYGLFLLVLLLHQRRDRMLFNSLTSPGLRGSVSPSPKRVVSNSMDTAEDGSDESFDFSPTTRAGSKRLTVASRIWSVHSDNFSSTLCVDQNIIGKDDQLAVNGISQLSKLDRRSHSVDSMIHKNTGANFSESALSPGSNIDRDIDHSIRVKPKIRIHAPVQTGSTFLFPISPTSSSDLAEANIFMSWDHMQKRRSYGRKIAEKLAGVRGSATGRQKLPRRHKNSFDLTVDSNLHIDNVSNRKTPVDTVATEADGDRKSDLSQEDLFSSQDLTNGNNELGSLLVDFLGIFRFVWFSRRSKCLFVGFRVLRRGLGQRKGRFLCQRWRF